MKWREEKCRVRVGGCSFWQVKETGEPLLIGPWGQRGTDMNAI